MATVKAGDRIKIVEREVTPADVKSGLYYDYFRNLVGVVDRVYEDDTVCVKIDQDSLPPAIQKCHIDVQQAVRTRWLNGLGQEQRDRLSETDRSVVLGYNLLVGANDIEPFKGKIPPRAEKKQPEKLARASEQDIEKAEEEYLKTIAEQA